MYRAFNVKIDENDIPKKSNKDYDEKKSKYRTKLMKIIDSEKELKAKEIKTTLLPNNENFDVFISHSHQDLELAKQFAIYLKNTYNLKCFIDSMYWGNIDIFLSALNYKYSVLDGDNGNAIYDYSKVKNACKHCDIILSSALTDMIDNCEVVFFLNTENSIIAGKNAVKESETYSPWIYHEIFTTSIIEKHVPSRIEALFEDVRNFSLGSDDENLKIKYEIDLSNFPIINKDILDRWRNSNEYSKPYLLQNGESLDKLYKILPVEKR